MDHSDLVSRVAESLNKPKTVVSAVLAEATKNIVQGLSVDGRVTVKDLGIFKRRDRPARKGRNPRTGEGIDIAAASSVKFQAAKAVRDQIGG